MLVVRWLACILLVLLAGAETSAWAEHVTSAAFIASFENGSMAGTTFPVFFSYDADEVAAQGDSYVTLKTFDFVLGSTAFTKTYINQGGQVVFRNGQLKNITASFQGTLPPGASVNNVTFGFGGDGVVGYVDRQGNYGLGSFQVSTPSAMLNAASFAVGQRVSPGSLASLFGTGLATGAAPANSVPLPSSLNGIAVTVAGIIAPLLYVSPTQINLQVPWGAAQGQASAVVSWNGRPLATLPVSIDSVSPGIFAVGAGTGQSVAINLDGSFAGPVGQILGAPSHPAKPGDYLMIFSTGLGAVTPTIPNGNAPVDGLHTANTKPSVFIGGVPAEVAFAGLAPQFVGVNQINVIVPQVAAGERSLQIEVGGVRTSALVTITVGAR